MNKISIYPNEVFKEITLPDKLKLRYAVSNKGRLISFEDDITCGKELKGAISDGYKLLKYKLFNDGKITYKHFFISKLVAENFIKKNFRRSNLCFALGQKARQR